VTVSPTIPQNTERFVIHNIAMLLQKNSINYAAPIKNEL